MRNLALADSAASKLRKDDDAYYRSYSNLLNAIIDFKLTGRIRLAHINSLKQPTERTLQPCESLTMGVGTRCGAAAEPRALALKAESEHKTVIILVIKPCGADYHSRSDMDYKNTPIA